MQKKTGGKAQAMNSAELAAMFDLRVFPQLLQPYLRPMPTAPHILRADYEDQCKAFAVKIGRPYAQVHYPFFLSLDNCKKHPWLRRLMLQPRLSNAERQQMDAELHAAVEAELDRLGDEAWRKERGEQTLEIVNHYAKGASRWQQLVPQHIQQLILEAQAAYRQQDRDQRRDSLHRELCADGLTWVQRWWRDRAFVTPWLRIIWPEQFMPLVQCAPEIHMAVEHMVRTLKAYVRRQFWIESTGADPWKAATFQKFLNDGVQSKGNGVAGLCHISGSWEKWPCTLAILAAEAGKLFTVEHTFGKNRVRPVVGVRKVAKRPRQGEHRVVGTAGGYIADSRWH
jgi:hypothetical protein